MKILLINDNSTHVGGAEVSVFGTHKLLVQAGHEVYFFGFGEGQIENSLILLHNKTKFFRAFGKFFFSLRVYRKLKKYILRINPDVIHLHNNYLYSLSVLLAIKHSKIPAIHTVHDWGLVCPSSWGVYRHSLKPCSLAKGIAAKCYLHEKCLSFPHFSIAYIRNKRRFYLERNIFGHFLPPSTALESDLKRYGFNPVDCLHHFIEFDQIEYKEKENKIILYVGALTKNKGVEYLIKAMPFILKKIPDAKLRIVGKGGELDNLRKLSENLAQVEFVGRIPHEDVIKEYEKASLLIMPSVWRENSPFVLYECLIASLPVVGTDIGGIPDLVQDGFNGYLAPAADPEAISEKAVKILNDKELQKKFSLNCKILMKEKLSTEKYLKTLLDAYKRVLIKS